MKRLRILMMLALTLCIMVLAGCGEEEKYNTAKNEVLTLMDEAYKVEMKNLEPLPYNELDKTYEEAFEKHKAVEDKIQVKLQEMEKLASKEVKLNNDLIELKNAVKEKDDEWLRINNNILSIQKTVKKPSSGWGEDPWDALVKKRAEQRKQ